MRCLLKKKMNTLYHHSQIHLQINKIETKCASLNHKRLKLITLKPISVHLNNHSIEIIMIIWEVLLLRNFSKKFSKFYRNLYNKNQNIPYIIYALIEFI